MRKDIRELQKGDIIRMCYSEIIQGDEALQLFNAPIGRKNVMVDSRVLSVYRVDGEYQVWADWHGFVVTTDAPKEYLLAYTDEDIESKQNSHYVDVIEEEKETPYIFIASDDEYKEFCEANIKSIPNEQR